jgi:two-component system nitrogen regulation sensor histidine kinase NtrY
VSLRIDADLTQAMGVVNESYKEYQQLKLFKHQIRTGYLLMLAMLTGLILFAAIWFGFYIAREISVPIQRLAEGTKEIARGNYEFQIRQSGDDEVGLLVKSFNTMTRDLRNSIQESKEQQAFIQTIMDNLALGVVAFDAGGMVTSLNPSARRLLGFDEPEDQTVISYADLFPKDVGEKIDGLVNELAERAEAGHQEGMRTAAESELSFISQGREVRVLCTAGRIPATEKTEASTVLLLDDITELSKAQKMSAWREVARRVAHEIKNPLTPIQLSAQRLQRILRDLGAGKDSDELVQVIVEHVASIKRLANEFSNFAMMPTAEFKLSDLNALISDTLAPFAESHQDISFHLIADNKLPDVLMDREQIRRILMNLVGNAVKAIHEVGGEQVQEPDGNRIVVKTWYDRKKKNVVFEVSDNGPGIPDAEKTRIFQPYYTTSKDGSGLGLAIVTTILADHQGQIRLYDNQPRGAKFIVELPMTPRNLTQRRFSERA